MFSCQAGLSCVHGLGSVPHAMSVPSKNSLILQQCMGFSVIMPMSAPLQVSRSQATSSSHRCNMSRENNMWGCGFLHNSLVKRDEQVSKHQSSTPRSQRGRGETKECLVFLVILILVCASHRKLGVNSERLSEKWSCEISPPCETA